MLCRSLTWTLVVLTTLVSAVPISDVDNAIELALRIPDNESGIKVSEWTVDMNMNPEELGNYLEGDIMVAEGTARNGAKDEKLRWPNGVIPYIIKGNFNTAQLNLIRAAMNEYEKYTCIRYS
ncbi:PREDICTED: zinc metalloproteinase nas-4-like [Wasmannia auropunctata]|uniref:zinc metalloproteinase nas-4-like n=1 Tax=Wasmannia auropunctata TaxID=64793 RepID=UPI0005EF71C6|nr:PREDICTED: zinc metalloproteinase nas-4-like [Wasmannia auropunctata]